MRVEIAGVGTARKTTPFVAGIQRASEWGRDGASLSTDIEWLTILTLYEGDQACVAGEAAHSFRGQRRAMLDFAASGRPVPQRLLRYVHHDLMAIGAGGLGDAVRQKAFGDKSQGVRSP